jgi:hypothetical protein
MKPKTKPADKPRGGRPVKFDPATLTPRQRLDYANALNRERENEVIAGKLIPRDEVERASRQDGGMVRSELLGLGAKIAPQLVGLDEVEIKSIVDQWATETLASWASWAGAEVER